MGAAKMQEAGWQPGWGLGRHVIGSNFFYYIRDPWGSFAEYFHDLDYIPEHCAWEPRDFPADRKSTRLNSRHRGISYAHCCLKTDSANTHTSLEERKGSKLQ